MEATSLRQLLGSPSTKKIAQRLISDVWDSVQDLNIAFELNPSKMGNNVIDMLEKTADEFAELIKEIYTQSDEDMKSIGELSYKILKLCIRLQNKIWRKEQREMYLMSMN